jgi:hypothetical protein
MADRYERVYDVNLLDDLHNYFPALLYNQDLFQTVPDVLGYIRQRTMRRFNLFDYGRRQYEAGAPRAPMAPHAHAQAHAQAAPPAPPRAPMAHTRFTGVNDLTTLIPLLERLEQLGLGATPMGAAPMGATNIMPVRTGLRRGPLAGLYEDVVVHASQDVINGASTETTLAQDLEDNCAICQDRMRQGELVRKLTACSHEFHRACIDNWLLRSSVMCPTCRHDIRQPQVANTSGRRSLTTSPHIGPLAAPLGAPAVPPLDPTDDQHAADELLRIIIGYRDI